MSAGRMRAGIESAAAAVGAAGALGAGEAAGGAGVSAASGGAAAGAAGFSGHSSHWGFAGWNRPLPPPPQGCQSGRSHAPRPPQTDDDNGWDTGVCMLYCRRENVRVLWLGPVHTPSETGEMYGCQSCVAELVHMVGEQKRRLDIEGLPGTRKRAATPSAAGSPARPSHPDRSPGQGNPAGYTGRSGHTHS